jgi:hypothetical protein
VRGVLLASLVASPVLAAAVALGACATVSELSVGSTPAGPDGGTDAPTITATPDASSTTTLLERLEQKCAAPAGQLDTYTNGAGLSARLKGRWYHCGSIGNWDLPRGTGVELQFGTTGTYAFLNYADSTQLFTPDTSPDMSGQILYLVFAGTPSDGGSDGGDAAGVPEGGQGGSMFIPINDTTTRNGIFVYLTRADLADYEFQMVFEQNPRKLHLNELGATPAFATFVPIDE